MVWRLLAGEFDRHTATVGGARRDAFDFPPVNRARAWDAVDAMRQIALANDASVAQIVLAWLRHQRSMMSIIIGVNTMQQLEDNLKSVTVRLSAEELEKLDQASRLEPEYPGWASGRQSAERSPN